MRATKIGKSNKTEWVIFGRDNEKPEKIIDTNQYLVKCVRKDILLDPGGIE